MVPLKNQSGVYHMSTRTACPQRIKLARILSPTADLRQNHSSDGRIVSGAAVILAQSCSRAGCSGSDPRAEL